MYDLCFLLLVLLHNVCIKLCSLHNSIDTVDHFPPHSQLDIPSARGVILLLAKTTIVSS